MTQPRPVNKLLLFNKLLLSNKLFLSPSLLPLWTMTMMLIPQLTPTPTPSSTPMTQPTVTSNTTPMEPTLVPRDNSMLPVPLLSPTVPTALVSTHLSTLLMLPTNLPSSLYPEPQFSNSSSSQLLSDRLQYNKSSLLSTSSQPPKHLRD